MTTRDLSSAAHAAEPGMDNPSGLGKLRAALAGDHGVCGFDHALHIKVAEAETGKIALTAPTAPDHANASGVMHGGWIAGVLDAASGGAVQSVLAPNEAYTTLALQVTYLRAVPTGITVRAEGRVVRAGGRVVTVEASVLVDGKACAIATATCLRLT